MANILAVITLLKDVEMPKVRGVRSGYCPHHRFQTVEYFVSGFHEYPDLSLHFPGETIETKIAFPSWKYFKESIKVGDEFEISELNRIVGRGVVINIF